MPLGTRKPVIFNTPHGNKTLLPYNIGDASIEVSGTVYAATIGQPTEKIFKWSDPTKTSSYTFANLPLSSPNLTGQGVNCICYDSTNTKLYCGYKFNDNGTNYVANIASVDPTTLSSTMLVNEYPIESDTVFPAPDPNNGIATDGTYIYFSYGFGVGGASNGIIVKFLCSTGAFVNSITLPNTGTGGVILTTTTLTLIGGFLYVTGYGAPPTTSGGYVGKIATDFSSATAITTGLFGGCDDIAVTSTSIWQGSELTSSPGLLCKTALDLSSTTTFNIPAPAGKVNLGWVDSILYDGTYLWVSLIQDTNSVGNPSQLVQITESTFTIVERYVPGIIHLNEIQSAGTGFWLGQYNTNNSIPSQVQYFPLS